MRNTGKLQMTILDNGLQYRRVSLLRLQSSSSKSQHTLRSSAPRPDAEAPTDEYYALLLEQPLPVSAAKTEEPTSAPRESQPPSAGKPASDQASSGSSKPSKPSSNKTGASSADKIDKARVIFGSRLAGPAARSAREESYEDMKRQGMGEWIASSWIPPKPEEPDNCCMSGCVNCVWDGYREEIENWVVTRQEAKRKERLVEKEQAMTSRGHLESEAGAGAVSMDDDGGGSEALWRDGDVGLSRGKEFADDALFEGVPVGIREFMKTEKRLGEMKRKRTERITAT